MGNAELYPFNPHYEVTEFDFALQETKIHNLSYDVGSGQYIYTISVGRNMLFSMNPTARHLEDWHCEDVVITIDGCQDISILTALHGETLPANQIADSF